MKKTPSPAPPRRGRRVTSAAEIQELRDRLEEAEETIDALSRGAVDAVVVRDSGRHQIYSLTGADQPYRVYVERMQEGAVTVSADGVILFCNMRFAEMIAMPLQRVIGSQVTHYVPSKVWHEISQIRITEGLVVKQQVDLKSKAEERMPVLLTASELPLEGQKVLCLVVTDLRVHEENVRLRTAKELAENASQAKDQFFAALSHELRTPLTPVLMTLSALELDPTLREDIREDVLLMRRNIELETKLVDDLLDLNRIATGKLKLQIQPVDLNEAVRQVCAICRSQETDEDITFEMEFDPAVGAVAADPSRLQQVLWNVLKNSIKFTPEKTPISVTTRSLPDGRCEVRVQDRGIGIPPEALPRIFDAFEQGEASITRQFGGLGLGLAICKAIVDLHHGSIRAQSAGIGHGATFIIQLPGHIPHSVVKAPAAPQKEPGGGLKLRLLVVEDHADTLHTLGRLLTSAGYIFMGATSVRHALDLASKEIIDIVVSDLGLPDGDGHQVMRGIRKMGKQTPGIAMSGYGMDEDVRRSRAAGFSEHLTKPVNFSALRQAISRLVPAAVKAAKNGS